MEDAGNTTLPRRAKKSTTGSEEVRQVSFAMDSEGSAYADPTEQTQLRKKKVSIANEYDAPLTNQGYDRRYIYN